MRNRESKKKITLSLREMFDNDWKMIVKMDWFFFFFNESEDLTLGMSPSADFSADLYNFAMMSRWEKVKAGWLAAITRIVRISYIVTTAIEGITCRARDTLASSNLKRILEHCWLVE